MENYTVAANGKNGQKTNMTQYAIHIHKEKYNCLIIFVKMDFLNKTKETEQK